MALANFNGLAIVYREDILSGDKRWEFHFKQSVAWISRTLGQKREDFKYLAPNTLTSSAPKAYSPAIKLLEIFSKDNADNMKHCGKMHEKETYFRF